VSDEERARNMIGAHWGFDRNHMRTAIIEALSAARAEEREALRLRLTDAAMSYELARRGDSTPPATASG